MLGLCAVGLLVWTHVGRVLSIYSFIFTLLVCWCEPMRVVCCWLVVQTYFRAVAMFRNSTSMIMYDTKTKYLKLCAGVGLVTVTFILVIGKVFPVIPFLWLIMPFH